MEDTENNLYHFAAKNNLLNILNEATKFDLDKRDSFGRGVIHYAALKGHLDALKLVITLGGKVEKCDLYGNSVLHFAVRSRNSSTVSFLINYRPSLIWIMDLNNFTAKELAELLEYDEIYEILEKFSNEFKKNFTTSEMFKIYMKETKKAQKRRRKYEKQMKISAKVSLKEYKAKKLYKFEYGCKIYSAYTRIVYDENIIFSEKNKDTF